MIEIWVSWIVIILFLLLSFLRPFFKSFRSLDGLVWLPVVSLLLILCIFPAYGFRPECIPLLIYAVLLNILNIPLLGESSLGGGSEEKSYDQGLLLPLGELVFLLGVIVPLFVFSPKIPLELPVHGIQTRTIHNESAKNDYYLRIYKPPTEENQLRPLVFLAPPEAGSVFTTDRICTELRNQGFIVVSYSRRGLDSPAAGEEKKHYVSPAQNNLMWKAFRQGTEKNKANNGGKFLESERQKDIEFLLPFICQNRDENGAVLVSGLNIRTPLPVFIVGYGAAGSAAAYLFEQPGFAARFAHVKGIAAIESRLWSAYQPGKPMEPRWLPQPDIPVLYLVSDRAFTEQAGKDYVSRKTPQNSYQAVLDTFKNSSGPAALAAFEGAGPLAYSDYPLTHPAYLYLFPGQMKNALKSKTPVADTAGFVGNFFLMLLKQADTAGVNDDFIYAPIVLPEKRIISSAALIERKTLPEF